MGFLWLRSFKYLCLYIIVTRNLQLAPFLFNTVGLLNKKRSKLEVSQEGKGARVEVKWILGREYLRLAITS